MPFNFLTVLRSSRQEASSCPLPLFSAAVSLLADALEQAPVLPRAVGCAPARAALEAALALTLPVAECAPVHAEPVEAFAV